MMAKSKVTSEEIAQNLEHNSRNIINAFMAHKLYDSSIIGLMSPHLHADFEGFPTATTSAEHVANLTNKSLKHPDWQIQILNACTSVNVRAGYGTTWITLGISGLPQEEFENVKREAVCILTWHRQEYGKWLLVEMHNVRGPGMATFGTTAWIVTAAEPSVHVS